MSLAIDNKIELQLPESLVQHLTELLGDRFSTAQSVREHHGKGEAYHTAALPDGVVYANSTEEVVSIIKACTTHSTPVIPESSIFHSIDCFQPSMHQKKPPGSTCSKRPAPRQNGGIAHGWTTRLLA